MGNFGGHAIPGSFFIIFSLWHVIQTCIHYFRSKRRNGPPFVSQTFFNSPCCPKFPFEPFLKLTLITIAVMLEIYTAFRGGKFVNIGNGQHVCMYSFFGLSSFLEILAFYRFYLPKGILHVAYILSFAAEGLLFYFHLHVKDPLEMQVHTLLLCVIVATIVAICVELYSPNNVLPTFLRSYFLLHQGVWFWQLAFILYPPASWEKWNSEDHMHRMLVTIIFCANAFCTFLIVMITWFVVACRFGYVRQKASVSVQNGYKPCIPTTTPYKTDIQETELGFGNPADDEEDALISDE